MLTSSFLMLTAASFILCISCSCMSGFPLKYNLDFTQPQMQIGQVTEGAMAPAHLFSTID
jgi:hypothetical protein